MASDRQAKVIAAVVTGCVLAVAAGWVVWTRMRPTYDAYGWLVWGRQVLHWNLNTDGAPSWKPLTFLFSLPYAIVGANPQMWLWMITASAAALAGAVLAGHLAYRLTGPVPRRPWAPWVAAAFAIVGVLAINGYSELVLIANSDPLIMTLCLGAIDCHLSGRRRAAFLLLVLASLGRPEAWAFAGLYGAWAWRRVPSTRPLVAAGLLVIPVAWFVVPAVTSHSWFISGDLALGSPNIIHGNKVVGVLDRLRDLYPVPLQLAAIFALALAVVRRDRVWLTLAGAALLWVAIEIAFAYHGWSAVPRYLLEPGAVLLVLAAAAVGWVLAHASPAPRVARWAVTAVVAALAVGIVPAARSRARVTHGEIDDSHRAASQLARLQALIADDGGAGRIETCGEIVTPLTYQSEVAWAMGLNVGSVGWQPDQAIAQKLPIVLFTLEQGRWRARPIHTLPADLIRCHGLAG